MKSKYLHIFFVLLGQSTLFAGNFLFTSGTEVYKNQIDYSQTSLDWADSKKTVADRVG